MLRVSLAITRPRIRDPEQTDTGLCAERTGFRARRRGGLVTSMNRAQRREQLV
ncbi:MAG: hypothetical protein ACXVHB_08665 [Solirubrobacteraceae bacterium]